MSPKARNARESGKTRPAQKGFPDAARAHSSTRGGGMAAQTVPLSDCERLGAELPSVWPEARIGQALRRCLARRTGARTGLRALSRLRRRAAAWRRAAFRLGTLGLGLPPAFPLHSFAEGLHLGMHCLALLDQRRHRGSEGIHLLLTAGRVNLLQEFI